MAAVVDPRFAGQETQSSRRQLVETKKMIRTKNKRKKKQHTLQLILRLFYILATLLQLAHRALDKLQLPSTSTTGESSRVEAAPSRAVQTFSMLHSVPGMKQLTELGGSARDAAEGRCKVGDKQQQALHFANFAAFSAICGILLFNP